MGRDRHLGQFAQTSASTKGADNNQQLGIIIRNNMECRNVMTGQDWDLSYSELGALRNRLHEGDVGDLLQVAREFKAAPESLRSFMCMGGTPQIVQALQCLSPEDSQEAAALIVLFEALLDSNFPDSCMSNQLHCELSSIRKLATVHQEQQVLFLVKLLIDKYRPASDAAKKQAVSYRKKFIGPVQGTVQEPVRLRERSRQTEQRTQIQSFPRRQGLKFKDNIAQVRQFQSEQPVAAPAPAPAPPVVIATPYMSYFHHFRPTPSAPARPPSPYSAYLRVPPPPPPFRVQSSLTA